MDIQFNRKQSALIFILKGLIPYSRQNLMLAYKPHKFFNELEKISRYRQATLKNAYWRGKKRGLIREDANRIPKLTAKGLRHLRPFIAKRLGKGARLMVIFDIPEERKADREKLRFLLKVWGFEQIQKSVWASDKDFRDLMSEAIEELGLAKCVEVYESLRLIPKK